MKKKQLNIFLVGPGLIGKTLLTQINNQQRSLLINHDIDLQVKAICSSKKMLFPSDNSIELNSWEEQMTENSISSNLNKFIRNMKTSLQKNKIFVDCTASEEITDFYEDILNSGISIVTPNKKANSGTYIKYKKLRDAMIKGNSNFFYETNVGAALPIISTIDNMILTGDKIEKIEGVFSGTLSYIFNNFIGKAHFSEVVKQAKEKGYTEPDPRDDLNGMDFARKLLILARELGVIAELKDIKVENLVPESCKNEKNIDKFFSLLKQEDDYFKDFKNRARIISAALRYIGTIDLKNNALQCSLQLVPMESPFFSLSGSDNKISILSERYKDRPLVIQGPGAGASVTAGGVFADILRCV